MARSLVFPIVAAKRYSTKSENSRPMVNHSLTQLLQRVVAQHHPPALRLAMCPTAAPVSASSLTLLSSGRFFSGLAAELAVGQSKEHPVVEIAAAALPEGNPTIQ
jgi:hypothetical protein